jgi:hypothetical protein
MSGLLEVTEYEKHPSGFTSRRFTLGYFELNKKHIGIENGDVCSKSSEFGVNFRLIQFMLSILGNHSLGSHPGRDCLMKNFSSFSLFLHRWPPCSVSLSHYVSKEESDTVGLLKTYQKNIFQNYLL